MINASQRAQWHVSMQFVHWTNGYYKPHILGDRINQMRACLGGEQRCSWFIPDALAAAGAGHVVDFFNTDTAKVTNEAMVMYLYENGDP
eukprot:118565-Chlamydomonas_euryale.AAC.1